MVTRGRFLSSRYRLQGHIAVPCDDLLTWAAAMEEAGGSRVAWTDLGLLYVSTVFLGLDHNFANLFSGDTAQGDPILFETMIGGYSGEEEWGPYQTRCGTWAEAEEMHQAAVEFARARVQEADAMLAESKVFRRQEAPSYAEQFASMARSKIRKARLLDRVLEANKGIEPGQIIQGWRRDKERRWEHMARRLVPKGWVIRRHGRAVWDSIPRERIIKEGKRAYVSQLDLVNLPPC